VVRGDVGIPVRLVAAHKEVAVGVPDSNGKLGSARCQETRKIYGRKVDPDFEDPDPILKGNLPHGFSVKGSVQPVDTFRERVHARMTGEDLSIVDAATKKFLDDKFDAVLHRMTQAVQFIGGKDNAAFSSSKPDFKNLIMAEEALEEAKKAQAGGREGRRRGSPAQGPAARDTANPLRAGGDTPDHDQPWTQPATLGVQQPRHR
jgi:hypothetical protein